MRSFTALQTFEASETKSVYVEGLSYTIRDGNRYLNALAEVWALQGKVVFNHNSKDKIVRGKGIVTDPPPAPPPVVLWAPAMEAVKVVDTPEPVEVQIIVEPPVVVQAPIQEAPQPEPVKDETLWEKTKAAWRLFRWQ